MKSKTIGIAILLALFSMKLCGQIVDSGVSGITLVAPRDSFSHNPFLKMADVNAKWVAVVPYAFTPDDKPRVFFGNNHQWWGETPSGVRHTIELAKQSGMRVMLKPQLWLHHGWVGDLEYTNESDWKSWESDYKEYILEFARIAELTGVDLLCIGTEFKKALQLRPQYWFGLIEEVRKVYTGPLTYCANWDEFENVEIWSTLDYIGVSAYFPLTETETPSVEELKKGWQPIKKRLQKLSDKFGGKKIIFTEYGYLSVDGCAGKTWELEKVRMQLDPNPLAQCNALEALYGSFCDEDFWAGGFLWKWYTHNGGRQAYWERDYTPQNKAAEKTIKEWHEQINSSY